MNQAEKFTTLLNHIAVEDTDGHAVHNREAFAVALNLAVEEATTLERLDGSVILTFEDNSNLYIENPQQSLGCGLAYPCIPAWVVLY